MKYFACAALTACAGLAFQRVVPLAALAPIVVACAVVPVALSWFLAKRSLWLVLPVSPATWLAVTKLLLPHLSFAQIVSGIADAWPRMLTTVLPLPSRSPALAGVAAVIWLSGTVSGELTARSRARLPALVPALGVLGAAMVLGADGPGGNVVITAVWVALAAFFLTAPKRTWVALIVIGVSVLAAVQVGPLLPHARTPVTLRRLANPPQTQLSTVDALDQLSAWLSTPDLELFTVAAPSAHPWRLAVLDRFDGRTWTSSGHFLTTGSRVPAPSRGTALRQQVTIAALSGVYLPAAESPVSVFGVDPVSVDPSTGVLITAAGLRPGLGYVVTSTVDDPPAEALVHAQIADDAEARAARELPPGAPDVLATMAQAATGGAVLPAQQATLLAGYLRRNMSNDPMASPGHTYAHIEHFLLDTQRGTSEQFATAYALLARVLGLPCRIVVGFAGGGRSGDIFTVRGADALAWAEVDFAGLGWVPFFPTPSASGFSDTSPIGSTLAYQQIEEQVNAVAPRPSAAAVRGPGVAAGAAPRATLDLWHSALVAGAVLVFVYVVAALSGPPLRGLRRRRIRDGTGGTVAAWRETLAWLGYAGVHVGRSATSAEAVSAGAARLGPSTVDALWRLAHLADAARYAAQPAPPEARAEAWRAHAVVKGRALAVVGRVRLIGLRLTLRDWRQRHGYRSAGRSRPPEPSRRRSRR